MWRLSAPHVFTASRVHSGAPPVVCLAVGIAHVLRLAGIVPTDSRNRGRERFHAYPPARLATGDFDAWFRQYSEFAGQPLPHPGQGLAGHGSGGCCAPDSVSFHYVEPPTARALHAIFANQTHWRGLADDQRAAMWPTSGVGGYDRVPATTNLAAQGAFWRLLLSTFVQPPIARRDIPSSAVSASLQYMGSR